MYRSAGPNWRIQVNSSGYMYLSGKRCNTILKFRTSGTRYSSRRLRVPLVRKHACVQTGRGGGAVARTSLPAPLHHRSERLERLVSATVLPPSTLCSTIRYTVCVHYKPITENSNCTLLLRYCTVCTRYSYPCMGTRRTEH